MDDRDMMGANDARNTPDATPRVAPLRELGDFQVADGYPDPRGWDVLASDGQRVGSVHDLIVDTGQLRTRYLDVSLDGKMIGASDDRDVLIPIGAAQLDDSDDRVMLASLDSRQLATLPEFAHDDITREYENSVLSRMQGSAAAASATDYYSSPHFDDNRFFGQRATAPSANANATRVTRSEEELDVGKRQVKAGEVDAHKRVDTEHVSQPVTVRREEVTIERRPLRADESTTANIDSDSEIRIPLVAEELVVQKRAVPKEEIVIKKRTVSEDRTVEGDVRKERIDIDRDAERR